MLARHGASRLVMASLGRRKPGVLRLAFVAVTSIAAVGLSIQETETHEYVNYMSHPFRQISCLAFV